MTPLLWGGVAALGGVGAVLRFLVDRSVSSGARGQRAGFPYGTLVVNVSGAALLGLLSGLAVDRTIALLAGTAVLGSYTTFSTWMLESHRLGEERRKASAALNILASIALGALAVVLGRLLGRAL